MHNSRHGFGQEFPGGPRNMPKRMGSGHLSRKMAIDNDDIDLYDHSPMPIGGFGLGADEEGYSSRQMESLRKIKEQRLPNQYVKTTDITDQIPFRPVTF